MEIQGIIKGVKVSPVNIAERKSMDLRAGDTVKVHQKIKEKDKVRLQVFEGLVLARKHGGEAGGTFTVRKVASGVGVEKIFPLYSPAIDKIEVVKRAKTRRAKLYHIREKVAREISREMRHLRASKDEVAEVKSPEIKTSEVEKKAEEGK
jgi:large subunit ribosomal protein L19